MNILVIKYYTLDNVELRHLIAKLFTDNFVLYLYVSGFLHI